MNSGKDGDRSDSYWLQGSLNGTPFRENQQMHSDFEAFPGKKSVKSWLFAITT